MLDTIKMKHIYQRCGMSFRRQLILLNPTLIAPKGNHVTSRILKIKRHQDFSIGKHLDLMGFQPCSSRNSSILSRTQSCKKFSRESLSSYV